MIEKLKLVHNNQDTIHISLHPQAVDILFEHRRYIKNVFLQIKGHYEIAYFSINIISPSNELISFSSMPHIEYNLIQKGLWKYDVSFSLKQTGKNILYFWEDIDTDNPFFEQIKDIRLTSNHFTCGMTLLREISGYKFLYSYAINSNKKNLKEYYNANILNLIDIGDYFCKSTLALYAEYSTKHPLPLLQQLNSKITDPSLRPALTLVVNNT